MNINVIILFTTLFICTFDGYSMMAYRLPQKSAYCCFAAVTLFCLIVNSYIAVRFDIVYLRRVILFTIGLPYFILILLITKDKISQTVFNFWLWINVYETISFASSFAASFFEEKLYMFAALRFVLLTAYFFLYNKFLKSKHRRLMEKLHVNWWIFSFIPFFFTMLIFFANRYTSANYALLFTIYILMFSVYTLIFYTFKTAYSSACSEQLALSMKKQAALQKKQYELYIQNAEKERILRHDARHRDIVLLSFLENGNIKSAEELIKKDISSFENTKKAPFCTNMLINAVLSEYRTLSEKRGIDFSAHIDVPDTLLCDETEFCVMLSNLLENSLEAAISFISVIIKTLNSQLLINVKNDFDGKILKDGDGGYLSTKENGSALGLKSVNAVVEKNNGFLSLSDTDGIFSVSATLGAANE